MTPSPLSRQPAPAHFEVLLLCEGLQEIEHNKEDGSCSYGGLGADVAGKPHFQFEEPINSFLANCAPFQTHLPVHIRDPLLRFYTAEELANICRALARPPLTTRSRFP